MQILRVRSSIFGLAFSRNGRILNLSISLTIFERLIHRCLNLRAHSLHQKTSFVHVANCICRCNTSGLAHLGAQLASIGACRCQYDFLWDGILGHALSYGLF